VEIMRTVILGPSNRDRNYHYTCLTRTWISQYQEGKTSLDLNEARDDGVLGCSGIAGTYANSLHLAPDR